MYQRLQNLRQNSRSVDDYTTELHQLVARNDLAETEEQLVSRYVGGLREQFQFTLNMFELFSVSDAYQKALQIEKQAIRRPSSTPWSATARPTVGNTSTKPIASLPPTNPPAIRAGASSGSGSKCFKCGEPGHRAFECRKGERPGKALFVDSDGIVNEQCESYEQEAAYDEEVVEEVVGDNGPLLVIRNCAMLSVRQRAIRGSVIVLLPSKEVVPKPQTGEGTTLLTRIQFEEELSTSKVVFVLIAKEGPKALVEEDVPAMV
ncbi:hypothetical protein Vadar_033175 [Vaccinium darrowii]|uniref:Uncharacterized protein n=1 Tax=Vaccinium darrowii TaxID=229202 RepID=A0ACB7Y3M6_9ERIC|nr:hypothetical protein Vadar_033175 [Vaccinium darrowii]